jgi:Mn-dependent DtxR family transcriptional regulator
MENLNQIKKEMQQKIIEVLQKSKEPLGRSEIAKKLKVRPETVTDRLTKLVKNNEVECYEIDRTQAMIRFGAKRRMRLYWINNK